MAMKAARFQRLATDFQWVHQGIGIFGSLTFFIGSIFFLWKDPLQLVGVWLFIIGSLGMLIGNVGAFIVKYGRHQLDL
ncbi:YrhK-like protein [Halopolyspora algeriensis]|uniref:YrhK-like protein n=1 Tax=Halopolyspora algeriensis TaxID=1500506 RepID=A0A368VUX8_9ACTN|nr:YrhK family protein [Halopolyspora algeriensis]RCW43896.1 YrhK-like protein [Halopolyspora algeriensis]TQM53601.1 YrhK-like protein [Halopolyspora algeriensis]